MNLSKLINFSPPWIVYYYLSTPERPIFIQPSCRSIIFIVKFEHILHLFLMFLSFTLKKEMFDNNPVRKNCLMSKNTIIIITIIMKIHDCYFSVHIVNSDQVFGYWEETRKMQEKFV